MAKAKTPAQNPAPAQSIAFTFEGCRPSAGSNLAAYTAAWMNLTGIAQDRPVPAKLVRLIAGDTALGYHVRKGNLAKTEKGIVLTEQGEDHFGNATANRLITVNPEALAAYVETFTKGTTNEFVKNAAFIKPYKG